jgi:hypothetical protein
MTIHTSVTSPIPIN